MREVLRMGVLTMPWTQHKVWGLRVWVSSTYLGSWVDELVYGNATRTYANAARSASPNVGRRERTPHKFAVRSCIGFEQGRITDRQDAAGGDVV